MIPPLVDAEISPNHVHTRTHMHARTHMRACTCMTVWEVEKENVFILNQREVVVALLVHTGQKQKIKIKMERMLKYFKYLSEIVGKQEISAKLLHVLLVAAQFNSWCLLLESFH